MTSLLLGCLVVDILSLVSLQAAVLVRDADTSIPKRLQTAASTRLNAAVTSLRQALTAELDASLQSCGWPPPMSSSATDGLPSPADWRPSSDAIPRLAALLDAVRIANARALPGTRDATPPPPAWSVLRMAAPLCERLRFHFTNGGPADRRDRPEWLLVHTLRMAAAYAAAAAASLPDPQPGTRQMPHAAALTLALAEEAAAVLRVHILPVMNAEAIGGRAAHGAWLHLADEAREFDAKLALIVGATAARMGGASRVLVEKAEWDRHWTRAELDAALRQIDSTMDADDAWHDMIPHDTLQEDDGQSSWVHTTTSPGMRPVCAVHAVAVIQAACTRAAVLPHASQQRAFLRDVPAAVASDFLGRVQRHARGAAAFGDPVAADSIQRAITCICAAHVLQLGLEALAEEPALWELEQQHASRVRPTGMQSGHTDGVHGGVFAPEAAHAQELHAKWRQALTQALVSQFMADAASLLPTIQSVGEATTVLAPAVLGLGSRLRQIRSYIDAALFASMWCV